ncbi:nonsense-mediated mRNA decay factor SMG5 isoform X1 [Hydra vulgaris]|uniref:Protein SMG5 n=1 Tax=Hydra vulgaris TaxID=6087 RepID=T2M3Q0_HYDVU|nr:nonsense-mediated mRNA decay factor SMG5 [Hydra vulgaris]
MCCLKTMKKTTPATSPNSVVNVKSEIQKLYRQIQQLSQRLDLQLQQAIDWKEWFDTETLQSRQRIRDLCEHILLSGECDIARKTEEYLWRKAFYDIIQKLKNDKKTLHSDQVLNSVYCSHLQGAIGFYHNLLIRIQSRFSIQLQGFVDWIGIPVNINCNDLFVSATDEQMDWAIKACQRCLIYLGDIARYQCDIMKDQDNSLPERYYHLAILLQPENGMPHNQIGTLKQSQLLLHESCYHYMRCVLSTSSFDGAEENLKRALEKQSQMVETLHKDAAANDQVISTKVQFETSFLMLQDVLFGIRSISMEDLAEWCQSLLSLFSLTLSENLKMDESGLTNGSSKYAAMEKSNNNEKLTSGTLVKLLTMIILDVVKLKMIGSDITSAATAFAAALLSQMLDYISQYLKLYYPINEKNHEDNFSRMKQQILINQRKRRRRRINSQSSDHDENDGSFTDDELSDLSEGDMDETLDADDFSDNEESIFALNDDIELDIPKDEIGHKMNGAISFNTKKGLNSLSYAGQQFNEQLKKNNYKMSVKPTNGLINHVFMENVELVNDAAKLLDEFEKINEEAYLPAVKILCDWMFANPDVLKMSAKASSVLWQRLADVLNALPSQKLIQTTVFYFSSRRRVPTWLKKEIEVESSDVQQRALPEDITVFGAPGFGDIHKNLDIMWFCGLNHSNLYQFALRVTYLRKFGYFVAKSQDVPCFTWNAAENKFAVVLSSPNEKPSVVTKPLRNKKKKLGSEEQNHMMQVLAKEKLKHEVNELEKQLHSSSASPSGSVYLVLDTPVLCKYISFLRAIVKSGQFVVIIPIQVIAALDDLKKYNQGARDGIKFLEEEIKHGNRWLKTQKDHETVNNHGLSNTAKKKNREIDEWRFLQIVKCCLYFHEKREGTVTLLTTFNSLQNVGKNSKMGTRPSQQTLDICKENNISVEPVVDFYKKWMTRGGPS